MTHILIKIEDIKDRINNIHTSGDEYDKGAIDVMNSFLKTGKQISLDEKDIEEKAIKNSRGYDAQSVAINCYKQALKDLL